MDNHQPTRRASMLITALVAALLCWIAIVVTMAQWQMAPTFDEQNHVARGIAILHTGDYRLCFHHPPLANILQGLPVAWLPGTWFSTEMPAWTPGDQHFLNIWEAARTMLWENAADGWQIIRLARIPVLLFTLGLAVLIFCWSRELFGPWGGVFSLALFALDPTVLAHSGLATTDAAAACTILLAVYLLRNHLRRPSRRGLLLAGVGAGLALASKFSALILVPITGLILLAIALQPVLDSGALAAKWQELKLTDRITAGLKLFFLIGVLGAVTVWVVYGCKVEALGSKPGQPLPAHASLKAHIPIPAKQYFRGLHTVKHEASGHLAYLLGKSDNTGKGWWYYFPVALATKTPLPELFFIIGSLVLLALPKMRARLALPRGELFYLLLPVVIYLLAALGLLGISLNLGVRHILPIFPFLFILAGGWVALFARSRAALAVMGVLVLTQCISVVHAYPNFIAYFNEAAGGMENGGRILIDSNYDWGQDLGRLAEVQKQQSLYPLAFSYFGSTVPAKLGVDCTYSAGFGIMHDAAPVDLSSYHGYFAISATELYGGPDYNGAHVDYRELLTRQPVARAGQTILVYKLP